MKTKPAKTSNATPAPAPLSASETVDSTPETVAETVDSTPSDAPENPAPNASYLQQGESESPVFDDGIDSASLRFGGAELRKKVFRAMAPAAACALWGAMGKVQDMGMESQAWMQKTAKGETTALRGRASLTALKDARATLKAGSDEDKAVAKSLTAAIDAAMQNARLLGIAPSAVRSLSFVAFSGSGYVAPSAKDYSPRVLKA